jgi:DNA-binding transcriptional LysR family regulator
MIYLFEAVRLGSIRAAADVLNVNASVISRQIASLEEAIGVALIERLGRGIRATEAGELLVQRQRQWIADQDDTIAKLREIQGLKRGHLNIVLGEGFVSDLMSGPLRQFWKRHPELTMSFDLGGTNEVVAAVAEDRYHLGLVYGAAADPRLRVAAASRQPIQLIAPPTHPLVERHSPPTLKEVAAYPLGLMHKNYGTRQVVELAGASEKISVKASLTTTSINILRQFVRSGLGVTLLPAFAVTLDITEGALVAAPVNNSLISLAEAQLITRRGRQLPTAASHLLRFLTAQMQAFKVDRQLG